ncbi:hypothetical protein K8T06_16165 [bacterium]|nr:hypothetical protein [bacterium]
MKRVLVFLAALLTFMCLSVEAQYMEVGDTISTECDFGARIDASVDLMYDTFINRNRAFLYGGRGKNSSGDEIFMDYHGDLWNIRLDPAFKNAKILWERCETDLFKLRDLDNPNPLDLQDEEYPPLPRYGHSGIICPTLDDSIIHWNDDPTLQETYLNFIVFGGMRQNLRDCNGRVIGTNKTLTDEVYVFSEYIINAGNDKERRYHWYRIESDGTEPWPSPRMYAQIVPLFNEQDPVDERNKFLIFGGKDANGICANAYVATFTRNMTPALPADTDNEWLFDMGLDVTFAPVIMNSVIQMAISVYGASVVYDPYFYHEPGNTDPTPRIIVMGGMRGNPVAVASDNVYVMLSDQGDWTNLTIDFTIDDFNDVDPDHERAFFSASLDYRNSTIQIVGGENSTGVLDETGELNLTDSSPEWIFVSGNPPGSGFPAVSHHASVCSMGNAVFCVEDWNTPPPQTPTRKLYIDKSDKGITKEWNIEKDALYGLTNPEAVTNTRRLRKGDTIYIHQTNDYANAVNDAYKCNILIPTWHSNITMEGIVYNGVKPLLYQIYNSSQDYNSNWYIESLETGRFSRDMSDIVYSHAKMTLRNLKFCHLETEPSSPQTLLPTTIPTSRLNAYTNYTSGKPWDLMLHHVDDPAIFMHVEANVENCDHGI